MIELFSDGKAWTVPSPKAVNTGAPMETAVGVEGEDDVAFAAALIDAAAAPLIGLLAGDETSIVMLLVFVPPYGGMLHCCCCGFRGYRSRCTEYSHKQQPREVNDGKQASKLFLCVHWFRSSSTSAVLGAERSGFKIEKRLLAYHLPCDRINERAGQPAGKASLCR
jgi:hypothetical protein